MSIMYLGRETPPSTCTFVILSHFSFKEFVRKVKKDNFPGIIFGETLEDVPIIHTVEWLIEYDLAYDVIPDNFSFSDFSFSFYRHTDGVSDRIRIMLDRYMEMKRKNQ